jgi:hypothetical protein
MKLQGENRGRQDVRSRKKSRDARRYVVNGKSAMERGCRRSVLREAEFAPCSKNVLNAYYGCFSCHE